MTAKEDMRGRLFGLAVSILMLAEAYALWRPQALGGLPQPDLGPFSQYRVVIALLSAGAGVIVLLAALMRETSAGAPSDRRRSERRASERRSPGPLTLELGAPQPTAPEPTPPPAAAPEPEPAPTPVTAAPVAAAPPPAHAAEELHDLDPFPGTEAALHSAEPVVEAALPTALEPTTTPDGDDRGRFLALSDEGHHFRAGGQLDEAHERYEAALALARRRIAAHPGNVMARRDLAAALSNLGDLHDREGRLDQAIALHEESLGVRQGLADEAPNDLATLRSLSNGLSRLADARDARGHRTRARDLFRLRAALDQRLSAMAPGDPEISAASAVTSERLRELEEALAV